MIIMQLLLLFQCIMSFSCAYNPNVYGDLKDKFIQTGEFSQYLLTLMLMASRVKLRFS